MGLVDRMIVVVALFGNPAAWPLYQIGELTLVSEYLGTPLSFP